MTVENQPTAASKRAFRFHEHGYVGGECVHVLLRARESREEDVAVRRLRHPDLLFDRISESVRDRPPPPASWMQAADFPPAVPGPGYPRGACLRLIQRGSG